MVYLKTSLPDQMERTSRSKKRPLDRDDKIRQQTLESLRAEYGPVYEELADLTYDTDNLPVKSVARDIIKELREQGYL